MRNILLSLGILFLGTSLYAVRSSSHTSATTAGSVLFTSAPIRITGITVGDSAAGRLSFFKSTSAAFTFDLSTFTSVETDTPNYYPVFGSNSSSFTYINKSGAADVTIWFDCIGKTRLGICPGTQKYGQR